MPTPPRTTGSGASDAPGMDARKTEHTMVAEVEDSFDRDLHGEDRAGQHAGASEMRAYTAYDVKELHQAMPEFSNAELKRIPVLAHGERLEQGGVYLDLAHEVGTASQRGRTPFVAQGGQEATEGHLYVPKARCDYELWNKLTETALPSGPEM